MLGGSPDAEPGRRAPRKRAATLADRGTTALPDVPKSRASHHWRVLRESGLLHQRKEGRFITMTLRRRDLDDRFPGLLDSVLTATEPGGNSSATRAR